MNLSNKIALGAIIIGVAGATGGCVHHLDARKKLTEIDRRPETYELNYLHDELYSFKNSGYNVIEKFRKDPKEWEHLQRMYDRLNELRVDPSVIANEKETAHYLKESNTGGTISVISGLLAALGAIFTIPGANRKVSEQKKPVN